MVRPPARPGCCRPERMDSPIGALEQAGGGAAGSRTAHRAGGGIEGWRPPPRRSERGRRGTAGGRTMGWTAPNCWCQREVPAARWFASTSWFIPVIRAATLTGCPAPRREVQAAPPVRSRCPWRWPAPGRPQPVPAATPFRFVLLNAILTPSGLLPRSGSPARPLAVPRLSATPGLFRRLTRVAARVPLEFAFREMSVPAFECRAEPRAVQAAQVSCSG